MTSLRLALAAVVAFGFACGAQAQGGVTIDTLIAQCAVETGAPGSYELATRRGASVMPGDTGTPRGAARINDCLLDKRAVQFGTVDNGVTAVAARQSDADLCRSSRNSRIVGGIVLTAAVVAGIGSDAAIVGGVAGAAAGIRGANNRYRECLANAETNIGGVQQIFSCSRGASPLVRGTGYCRR